MAGALMEVLRVLEGIPAPFTWRGQTEHAQPSIDPLKICAVLLLAASRSHISYLEEILRNKRIYPLPNALLS